MEKKDLKKLTKGQLIKLLLKKEKKKPKVVIVDDTKPVPTPRTYKSRPPVPTPRKSVNDMVQFFENKPTPPPRTGKWENVKPKPVPRKSVKQMVKEYDDIIQPPEQFRDGYKPIPKPRTDRQLQLRIKLPKAISTKFNKVENFKLGDLENVINILEYRAIHIEKCKIVVQSVKIPAGKGRLHLIKDTVSRKNCIIKVKNDDTTCLARSIVTAMANLHPEKWTKTQLKNGFNSSRKLQRDQAMKLHKEAYVEIHDYGNDLSDVETFAKHLGIEINIIDAEQFNSFIYTANKGSEDKIYLLKTRNHFDVVKSMTAFYDSPYYCQECKKTYTKRDKHMCPSKCLSCFTYAKERKCDGKEIVCEKCNRKFFGKRCFKNHLKNRTKVEGKTDVVCNTVKKCLDCNRIITGKYVNSHKYGYSECTNCGKYVGKNHKCFMKKIKAKGGYCTVDGKKPCKNNDSIKKKDWCLHREIRILRF